MKIHHLILPSVAVLFCAASASASGIWAHTWVSGSGSDSNNTTCAFTTPCATFAAALANTSSGGMITAKDAGDFGTVNISQSIIIDGNNVGSISDNGTGSAIFITGAATNHVTIRNLTINGTGSALYGIEVENGGTVIIDNCRIMNITFFNIVFNGQGNLTVENSRLESFIYNGTDASRGIQIQSTAAENVVVRNTVIDASSSSTGNYGFVISAGAGPVQASLQNVTIMGAGNAAVETWAGITEITGSVLTQSNYGVYAYNGAIISVAGSMITANTFGVCSNASSKIRLDNNDIYDNTTAIANCSGIVKTSGTNKTSGTIAIPASDVSDSVTF